MAGRGVDIKLGGPDATPEEIQKVKDAGGLFVLGTERHESRRIDNQLRGRSARQGDPGETQFFVSTDDDLMRIFAGERLKSVMTRFNMPEEVPIEQKFITRMLESAQKKVESHHFDTRKHLLEYDDVLNKQREVVYKKRRQVLTLAGKEMGEEVTLPDELEFSSLHDMIIDMVEGEIEFVVSYHTNSVDEENKEWNVKEVYETMKTLFPLSQDDRKEILSYAKSGEDNKSDIERRDKLVKFLVAKARHSYGELMEGIQDQVQEEHKKNIVSEIQKSILLRTTDNLWVDYLVALNHLRSGIGLQGYGQRDPLIEYKKESFHLFNQLLSNIQKEVAYTIFKVNIGLQLAPSIMATDKMSLQGAKKTSKAEAGIIEGKTRDDDGNKVGRNDPCPCGSGKKYKKCHGK